MKKDRVVFFASGDFAIDTFEMLINNGSNIVGLVTSNDKVKFHKETIAEIAYGLNIPTYTVKNNNLEEDEFLYDWLKRVNGDIFCVISFKKLPQNIIKLAKKCAFNVHASLLPFLRGSAPINWAIRLDYKETGLTAFVLNDKIDCGDIIANHKVKIATGEKYTTLYKKLSDACVDFTDFVINDILQEPNWKKHLISQPTCNETNEHIHKATKINSKYFECHWKNFYGFEIKSLVDSVDDVGLPCTINVEDNEHNITKYPIKIYDVEVLDEEEEDMFVTLKSDGKTYIKLYTLYGSSCVAIKKIQLVGKKVMDVETFLNGFRYFREGNNTVYITDLVEDNDIYKQ